jgi:rubrerythrin
MFLYRLFRTHFELAKESELDRFDISDQHLEMRYYAKDFEDLEEDEYICQKCDNTFPIKKEDRQVNELYGNMVMDIETNTICIHCGHLNHSEIRFKRGYVMTKKDGEWVCLIPRPPLIVEFFQQIVNIFR